MEARVSVQMEFLSANAFQDGRDHVARKVSSTLLLYCIMTTCFRFEIFLMNS